MKNRFLSDDSDVKIADFSRMHKTQPSNESEQQFLFHKANGDLEKAAALGKKLAQSLSVGLENLPSAVGSDGGTRLQRQLLFCFAVEVTLEHTLEDAVLAQSAQNAFYSALQQGSPQFYRYLNDSGVFSFYLLAYRRGGNVEHSISKVFAMLNDDHEDGRMAEVGETLYCAFCDRVNDAVIRQQFGGKMASADD